MNLEVAAKAVEMLLPVAFIEGRRQHAAVLLLLLLFVLAAGDGGCSCSFFFFFLPCAARLLLDDDAVGEGPEPLAQVAQPLRQIFRGVTSLFRDAVVKLHAARGTAVETPGGVRRPAATEGVG